MKSVKYTLVALALACTGCSHLYVCNTTKDGRVFEAYAWAFLWDRQLSNLAFNYEKGTLGIAEMKSSSDKETIAKGMKMIGEGAALLKAGAL